MNLRLFFEQLEQTTVEQFLTAKGLASQVKFHQDSMPDWTEADLALLTVEDNRGNANVVDNTDYSLAAFRDAFYALSTFSKSVKLIDLGKLRIGEHIEDTKMRLAEVCELLMSHNTLPIIIGGSHDLDLGQYLSYQNLEKLISVVNVDARIDLEEDETASAKSHIHQLLTHAPNYLFDYNHLGYQRYLNHPQNLETLQSLNFEAKSSGEIRGKLLEIEPIVRMGDMLSFDLSAIKNATPSSTPFGLTGEEACQICWYAGLNEKLTSIGLYEYQPKADGQQNIAQTLAIMVWYFIEGFCHRKTEYSFKSNFHIKYHVPLESTDQVLIFYKSKITDKWWLEVGDPSKPHREYGRKIIIPCSYSDYQIANKGELPERWIKAQDKIG